MSYESIKETLYKKFCGSIGKNYYDRDFIHFRDKADKIYKDFRNKLKEFKNQDKEAFIEQHKDIYKMMPEDEDTNRKGRNSKFSGLYNNSIGADERILDEILVSILKAAWEDNENEPVNQQS